MSYSSATFKASRAPIAWPGVSRPNSIRSSKIPLGPFLCCFKFMSNVFAIGLVFAYRLYQERVDVLTIAVSSVRPSLSTTVRSEVWGFDFQPCSHALSYVLSTVKRELSKLSAVSSVSSVIKLRIRILRFSYAKLQPIYYSSIKAREKI